MNTAVTWGDLFWIAVGMGIYFVIVKPLIIRGRRKR